MTLNSRRGVVVLLLATAVLAGAGPTTYARLLPAEIQGRVLDRRTNQPISGALVTLAARTATQSFRPLQTETDASGRYQLQSIPRGNYLLSATRPGFSPGTYGQRFDNDFSSPVEVGESSGRLGPLDIQLSKLASISGQVRDPAGRPEPSAKVIAFRPTWLAGREILRTFFVAFTDKNGQFEIRDLPAGQYMLGVTDSSKRTSYYPGGHSPTAAARIALDFGQDLAGLVIPFQNPTGIAVTGVVRRGAFQGGVQVDLIAITEPSSDTGVMSVEADETGRFSFAGVQPGRYTLNCSASEGYLRLSRRREANPWDAAWCARQIDVTDQPPRGLEIDLQPGYRISGRVVWSPPGPMPKIAAVRMVPLSGLELGLPPTVSVGVDGTFSSSFVRPGDYALGVRGSGWFAQSITSGGREIVGRHLSVDRNLDDLVIVLTEHSTALTGIVEAPEGKHALATVLVYPAQDGTRYVADAPPNLFARIRVTENGQFRINGLPAGEYSIAAVLGRVPGDWQNSEAIRQLKLQPKQIRLTVGSETTVTVSARLPAP